MVFLRKQELLLRIIDNNDIIMKMFRSTSTTLTITLLLSNPHGNEMKSYGSCALIITISDFRVRQGISNISRAF